MALSDSVAAHLVADVPVGVFLSAGINSTSIMSIAAGMTPHLKTLTLGFEEYRGTDNDETAIAETVARIFDADHQTAWVTAADFRQEHDCFFSAMDQPTVDGLNTYFVSRAASRAGLKVAMSGLGGDELFAGYPSFTQIPKLVRYVRPLRSLPIVGRGFRLVTSRLIGAKVSPKFAGLLEYGASIEDAYLLRRALFMPWELPSVLDPEIVRIGWQQLQPLLRLRQSTEGMPCDRARIGILETSWYMRNQLLRDTDWAAMAHSVEVRTPLVDAELLRHVAAMSCGKHPAGKRDLALATPIRRVDAVINRPKTGFSVPVRDWLNGTGEGNNDGRGLRGWAKTVFSHYVQI